MENTRVFPTIASLEKYRVECLRKSEKAVNQNPEYYYEIKRLLTHVVSNPVDISEYEDLAKTIADLLEMMGRDTIFFHYFHENINPRKYGTPKFLRFFCRDLLDQLTELNKWRAKNRNIRSIL